MKGAERGGWGTTKHIRHIVWTYTSQSHYTQHVHLYLISFLDAPDEYLSIWTNMSGITSTQPYSLPFFGLVYNVESCVRPVAVVPIHTTIQLSFPIKIKSRRICVYLAIYRSSRNGNGISIGDIDEGRGSGLKWTAATSTSATLLICQ